MAAPSSLSVSSQSFVEKAGLAWVRMQERTDALVDPLGRIAMDRLRVEPGERVLDVGCGCGQTVLQLAALSGGAGHVLGIDISPPMLARAQERLAQQPAISLALADAQTFAFASPSFDALYSRFGVMFFDDALAAFGNLRRGMRPGGRLSFVCWQALAKNPWAARPLEAVTRLLPSSATPNTVGDDRPGPFFLSDPARVQALLAGAGWNNVTIEPVVMPLHFGGAASLDEAVAYAREIGPAARAMAEAPANLQLRLETVLREALAPFVTDRGVFIEGAALVVGARA